MDTSGPRNTVWGPGCGGGQGCWRRRRPPPHLPLGTQEPATATPETRGSTQALRLNPETADLSCSEANRVTPGPARHPGYCRPPTTTRHPRDERWLSAHLPRPAPAGAGRTLGTSPARQGRGRRGGPCTRQTRRKPEALGLGARSGTFHLHLAMWADDGSTLSAHRPAPRPGTSAVPQVLASSIRHLLSNSV